MLAIGLLSDFAARQPQDGAQLFDFLADAMNGFESRGFFQRFQRIIQPFAAETPHGLGHGFFLFEAEGHRATIPNSSSNDSSSASGCQICYQPSFTNAFVFSSMY